MIKKQIFGILEEIVRLVFKEWNGNPKED